MARSAAVYAWRRRGSSYSYICGGGGHYSNCSRSSSGRCRIVGVLAAEAAGRGPHATAASVAIVWRGMPTRLGAWRMPGCQPALDSPPGSVPGGSTTGQRRGAEVGRACGGNLARDFTLL